MKRCPVCGVMFTPPSDRRGNNMKYCSDGCRATAYNKSRKEARRRYNKLHSRARKPVILCEWCAKPFISRHNTKYCSIICRRNARREQINRHVKHYKATHQKSDKQKYFDNLGNSNLRQHRHQQFKDEERLVRAEKRRLHI